MELNRLYIIGNGFDLAHGLPTSYGNFLDDYWEEVRTRIRNENGFVFNRFEDEFIIVDNINSTDRVMVDELLEHPANSFLRSPKIKVVYTNKLFSLICRKSSSLWVDIENEYYNTLLKILNKHISHSIPYTAKELNNEFDKIKYRFIEYIKRVQNNTTLKLEEKYKHAIKVIKSAFYEGYSLRDLSNNVIAEKVDYEFNRAVELQSTASKKLSVQEEGILYFANQRPLSKINVEGVMYTDPDKNPFDLLINKTQIITFNYTNTCRNYQKSESALDFYSAGNISHIHGKIENENEIVFGFGDEMDIRYHDLENQGDSEYLKNVKSVKYLQNDTYRQMLRFINEGYFQIYLLGHSCGNSDRTLLNTLFEHENCCSIKTFYYQYKDDNGNVQDDFEEKTINITRCFKDKGKLREIVVNKEFCRPLVPVK